MLSSLKINLFGYPSLWLGGQSLVVEERKAVALLAYLAVNGGPSGRDQLAALLWPELERQKAQSNLRHALWSLRQAGLSEWLEVGRDSVALRPGYWCDVREFQLAVESGRRAEAAGLYRADFLAGLTLRDAPEFESWQSFQAEQQRQHLAGVLQGLASEWKEAGDYPQAITCARRWLSLDPLCETAHRLLMELFSLSGQQAAAVKQYQECVRLLDEELGSEPEEQTTQLFRAILNREVRAQEASHPGPAPRVAAPKIASDALPSPPLNRLPVQPTPFIGREAELSLLDRLLSTSVVRLVTIAGPGGMGKTRLALASAERQFHRQAESAGLAGPVLFPDGVHFIPLASLTSTEQLAPALADALGFRPDPAAGYSLLQQLLYYLQQKRILLILDNFEHLLSGTDLISSILQSAPGLKLLVTSRERLRLQEEQVVGLEGLPHPSAPAAEEGTAYPAVQLFLEAAQRARHDYIPTPADLPHVIEVCRLTEGLPLGIELAAAWVDVLPVADIAVEIRKGLDLLATQARNVPARQRSIRALFDWSWQRMQPQEQLSFAQLSVFRGGFTRAAAREVAEASVLLLSNLVGQSLLSYDRQRDRYHIHELLRQYGAEKLGAHPEEERRAHTRHAEYFCSLLRDREPELRLGSDRSALLAVEAEDQNLWAAWQYAALHGLEGPLAQAANPLGLYIRWRGYSEEGVQAFHLAAQSQGETPASRRLRAIFVGWQGTFCRMLGRLEEARQLLQGGLELLEGPEPDGESAQSTRWFIRLQLGLVLREGGWEGSRALLEQSLADARSAGSAWQTGRSLSGLAILSHDEGNFPNARQYFEEALALAEAEDDRFQVGYVLDLLSQTAAEEGRLEEAERLVRRSNAIYRAIGDSESIATGLYRLGTILMWLGRFPEAVGFLLESDGLYRNLGNLPSAARVRCLVGLALAGSGTLDRGLEEVEAGTASCRQLGNPRDLGWALWVLGYVLLGAGRTVEARAALEESTSLFDATRHTGRLGWSLSLLAYTKWREGEIEGARADLLRVLTLSAERRQLLPVLEALPTIALLLAGSGQAGRALELFHLAWRYPIMAQSLPVRNMFSQPFDELTRRLPHETVVAARARAAELDLWETVAQLPGELAALGWK